MSETEITDPEGEQATTSTTVQALRPDTEGHDLTVKVNCFDDSIRRAESLGAQIPVFAVMPAPML